MKTFILAHFSLMNGELKQVRWEAINKYSAMLEYLDLSAFDYPDQDAIEEYLGHVEEWLEVYEL